MDSSFVLTQASGLLVNFISTIMGALCAVAWRYFCKVLPAKRLWGLANPQKLVICAATNKTDTGEYLRPSTGIGQVRALTFIIVSLNLAYKKAGFKRIVLSEEEIGHRIEDDLLLLGGPKNNQVTRMFFTKYTNDYVHQDDNGTIHWKNKDFICNGKIADGKVIKDYGLIVKMTNPFDGDSKTRLILCSGCHTYGTIAASKFFCETFNKALRRRSWMGFNNIAALVSCDVVDGYPVSIKLEDMVYLNESN